jgi:hypothetical protein
MWSATSDPVAGGPGFASNHAFHCRPRGLWVVGMVGPDALKLGQGHPVELGPLGRHERRHERHHDHAAGPTDQLEDVISR